MHRNPELDHHGNKKLKPKRPKSAFAPFFQNSYALTPNNYNNSSYLLNSNSSLNQNPFYKYISSKNEKYYLYNNKDDFNSTSILSNLYPSASSIDPSASEYNSRSSNLSIKKNLKSASSINNSINGTYVETKPATSNQTSKSRLYKNRYLKRLTRTYFENPFTALFFPKNLLSILFFFLVILVF